SNSSSVGASAAAGMSSQCPLHTEASSSQAAEMVKMTGFDIGAPREVTAHEVLRVDQPILRVDQPISRLAVIREVTGAYEACRTDRSRAAVGLRGAPTIYDKKIILDSVTLRR